MKIMELCADERPREKMRSLGVRSLSNAELLAVLIRTGTPKKNAVEVAQGLMRLAEGRLSQLYALSLDRLCAEEGVGPGKAQTILAALELGRRSYGEEHPVEGRTSVTGPRMVYDLMAPLLRGLDHEECWVVYLNRANYVLGKEMVSSGGSSATVIDTRYIVRKVIERQASAVALVHNHPTGNPRPSDSDLRETQALRRALDTFDILLLDHVILADSRFFSFSENRVVDIRRG